MKYALINKIRELLPDLEALGLVYIFAFAEREDIPRWDVIISSKWSDKDMIAAIRVVSALLLARLETDELVLISRIAVIPSSEPNIQDLPPGLDGTTPKDEKVIYADFLGSEVRRAFVFKVTRPPALAESLAATGAAAS